jgi:aminoglycoside phosphotransferase (APT) family kinase protein
VAHQWSADITLTEAMARSLIEDQFPELAPVRITEMGEGWDNQVYLVNDWVIFRFPRRKVAVSCLVAENRVLPHIAGCLPVAVPEPRFWGQPTEPYPYPFTGYPLITGKPAHQVHLSGANRIKLAQDLGESLRILHRIPVDEAMAYGAERDTLGRMDLTSRVAKCYDYLDTAVRYQLVDKDFSVTDVIQSLPSSLDATSRLTLVHGDLNFRNFLVNDVGRLSGIIDWGDVHIGHPSLDVAVIAGLLPTRERHYFFDVYGDVGEEFWALTRFRALYTNLYILVYAYDIGDREQLSTAQKSLRCLVSE